MCWRLPFVLWMLMGLTPFIFAGANIYFDGWHKWLHPGWLTWVVRMSVALIYGKFTLLSAILWLTPCPR